MTPLVKYLLKIIRRQRGLQARESASRTRRSAALLGLGVVTLMAVASCGGSSRADKEHCLYAAVVTYPAWTSSTSVVDGIEECKSLSDSDRAEVKRIANTFVQEAVRKELGHG
jgi:hypothetical protein